MKTGTFQTHTTTGFYPLHYKIWGEGNRETLVCSAGLMGNSDDFKFIGETLAELGYRVVALDLPGRGLSAYFKDPTDYNFRQYIADLNTFLVLIGCSGPHSCDWFGVSTGGLLGIRLAGMENSPIRRLIISDIGPEVPQFDVDFILKVMSSAPEYKTLEDALPFFKMALGTPYSRGPMNDAQWLHMVNTTLKKRGDGMYIRNSDPAIADMFAREPTGEIPLWPFWDKIEIPVLAVRGGLSTLFPVSVANEMIARKKGAAMELVTIPDCGHVPSFFRDDHIKILTDWLHL